MADAPLAATPEGVDPAAWDAACAAVRAYCGWHVAPSVTETVVLDGSDSSVQMLPSLHVTGLSSVTNNGTPVTDPEWSEAGMVRGNWTGRFRGVTAELTHGYDMCPTEIIGVLTEAASRGVGGSAVSQVGQVRMGDSSGTPGAASFMLDQKAVLDRYKIPARP